MPRDLTDDKSTVVQVKAWCRQATSHYLSQCWPRFMSPYGFTRPQWVKRLTHPAMMRQPNWSTINTSSSDGGEQNRCWKICNTDSCVLGVSLSTTATCPKVRMVFLEIRLDSLERWCIYQYIEAWTKWLTYSRIHIQMHFVTYINFICAVAHANDQHIPAYFHYINTKSYTSTNTHKNMNPADGTVATPHDRPTLLRGHFHTTFRVAAHEGFYCIGSSTLVHNKFVDHSDAVGASPVDAAPTTSSLSN